MLLPDTVDGFVCAASRLDDRTTVSVSPLTFGRFRVSATPAAEFRQRTLGTLGQV